MTVAARLIASAAGGAVADGATGPRATTSIIDGPHIVNIGRVAAARDDYHP